MPDMKVSVRQLFGIESDMEVPAYSKADDYVPDTDPDYRFDRQTTLAILAGFAHNRRVIVSGYHGTGKSTHIEQVAARLNWPCVRVNLDSHISRIDLIGKDAIVIKDGLQVTEFRDGILPWAYQNNVALCFDEYDAGRPDVMFAIQRVLESSGRLTLLDQSRVIRPHPAFRCSPRRTPSAGRHFASIMVPSRINQAQMDRWSIVTTLNYLPHDNESKSCSPRRSTIRPRTAARSSPRWSRSPTDATPSNGDPNRDEPAHRHHLGGERRHLATALPSG
jgi:cobaltochelatase CobS